MPNGPVNLQMPPKPIPVNNISNPRYNRSITPKRVTRGGAHLRSLAPGQHSSEETSIIRIARFRGSMSAEQNQLK